MKIKKFLILIVAIVALIVMLLLVVSASEEDDKIADTSVSVSNDLITEADLGYLFDKTLYEEDVKDVSLENKLIVKSYYNDSDVSYITEPFMPKEVISWVEKNSWNNNTYFYAVEDTESIVLCKHTSSKDGAVTISKATHKISDALIKDLKNIDYLVSKLGRNCTEITGLYLFTDYTPAAGLISLYVFTDKGFFVRAYNPSDNYSQGVWFTEKEYEYYALAYQKYRIESSYDENGEPLGGQTTFWPYIQGIAKYPGDDIIIPDTETGSLPTDTPSDIPKDTTTVGTNNPSVETPKVTTTIDTNKPSDDMPDKKKSCAGMTALSAHLLLMIAIAAAFVIKKK